jgi:phosphate transport system substrate-binding protein
MTISGSRILVASVLGFVATVSPAATVVEGAGATFPYPIYAKWFDAFHRRFPDFEIRYQAIGSEGGVQRLLQHKVDFAASDAPLSGLDVGSSSGYVQFPAVLGAVVPIYNVSRASGALQFTPEALAGIYLGTIRRWNDPVLKAANHGASLPDEEIVVVHRSDGSGTSYIWTEYLSKVSSVWKSAVGARSMPAWPVGRGANGNDGVAKLVSQTANSIGYVEFIYALQNRLNFGVVRNQAGKFVQADLDSIAEAAKGATARLAPDLGISITNAPGQRAYPIASFSWFIVPARIEDAPKKKVILEFLKWMLGPGQKQAAALGFVSLPSELIVSENQILEGF